MQDVPNVSKKQPAPARQVFSKKKSDQQIPNVFNMNSNSKSHTKSAKLGSKKKSGYVSESPPRFQSSQANPQSQTNHEDQKNRDISMSSSNNDDLLQGPFFRCGHDQEGKNERRLQWWKETGKGDYIKTDNEFKVFLFDRNFVNLAKDKLMAHDYNRGARGRGQSNNCGHNNNFNFNNNRNQSNNGQGHNKNLDATGW